MKRRLWTGLILSLAAVGWFRWGKFFPAPADEVINSAEVKPLSLGPVTPQRASILQQNLKRSPAPIRKPSSQRKTHPGLPEGFSLAEDVYARADFNSNQGELLEHSGGLFFIRSSVRPEGSTQAVEDKYGRYYAINKSIKLSGINEQKRQELIQLGVVEQYYHSGLGLFYAEAPEDPLTFYDELKEKGFSPALELNRKFHQKR